MKDFKHYYKRDPNGKRHIRRTLSSPGEGWTLMPREPDKESVLLADGEFLYTKSPTRDRPRITMNMMAAAVIALKDGDPTKVEELAARIEAPIIPEVQEVEVLDIPKESEPAIDLIEQKKD